MAGILIALQLALALAYPEHLGVADSIPSSPTGIAPSIFISLASTHTLMLRASSASRLSSRVKSPRFCLTRSQNCSIRSMSTSVSFACSILVSSSIFRRSSIACCSLILLFSVTTVCSGKPLSAHWSSCFCSLLSALSRLLTSALSGMRHNQYSSSAGRNNPNIKAIPSSQKTRHQNMRQPQPSAKGRQGRLQAEVARLMETHTKFRRVSDQDLSIHLW